MTSQSVYEYICQNGSLFVTVALDPGAVQLVFELLFGVHDIDMPIRVAEQQAGV